MFKAFDKLSLRAKTYLIVIAGFVFVSLQIWQVLYESRQGVQILYIVIAVGFVAMMGMLLSSVHSIDKSNTEIKRIKNEIHEVENQTEEKQLFVKNVKEVIGRRLKETSNMSDKLEKLLVAQDDEQSRKILAALKEPFAENKRVLKELESI